MKRSVCAGSRICVGTAGGATDELLVQLSLEEKVGMMCWATLSFFIWREVAVSPSTVEWPRRRLEQ
jgi:hypothetical protein